MPYKDKNKQREYERIWKQNEVIRVRKIVVDLFGGKCEGCGYSENILALQIDHIDPILRPSSDRKSTNRIWRQLAYGKISRSGLQLLCANCHVIKTLTTDIKKFNKSKYIMRAGETVISTVS